LPEGASLAELCERIARLRGEFLREEPPAGVVALTADISDITTRILP
jgi:hypothetical protein